jgi:hypothetical protein
MANGRPGRLPHSTDVVVRVGELRAFGHSIRAIAAKLHIGRTAVANILAGKHRLPRPSTDRLDPGETRVGLNQSVRCPACGTPLAVLPCRVCRVNALLLPIATSDARVRALTTPSPAEADAILAFDLPPEETARFEEVRKARGGHASPKPLIVPIVNWGKEYDDARYRARYW